MLRVLHFYRSALITKIDMIRQRTLNILIHRDSFGSSVKFQFVDCKSDELLSPLQKDKGREDLATALL